MENETKEKLLQATRTIIDESGLDAVTLREVGTRANLSRGAAYRHFRDKEGLLAAIAADNFERLLKDFEHFSLSKLGAREIVRALLLQFHSFGIASPVHYQLMFSTTWDKKKYPGLHQKAEMVFDLAHGLLTRFLEADKAEPARTLNRTAIVFAFIHGLVELHLTGHFQRIKGLDDTEKLVDEIIGLVSAY